MQQKTLVDAKIFSARLKGLQGRFGVKSNELSRRLGVSEATVSQWRSGRHLPDRALWEDLCDVFRSQIDDLFFARSEESSVGRSVEENQIPFNSGRLMYGLPASLDGENKPQDCGITRAQLEAELALYLDCAQAAGALSVAAIQIRKHLDASDFEHLKTNPPTKKDP